MHFKKLAPKSRNLRKKTGEFNKYSAEKTAKGFKGGFTNYDIKEVITAKKIDYKKT